MMCHSRAKLGPTMRALLSVSSDQRGKMNRSTKAAFAAVAALLPLLASCAQSQPAVAPTPAVTAAEAPNETPSATPTTTAPVQNPTIRLSPKPKPTTTKTTAKPSPTPTKTTSAPAPGACAKQVVKYRTKSACAKEAQTMLKAAGFYTGSVDGRIGVGAVNAVLNYQRSRGLADTGMVDAPTWAALYSKKAAIKPALPARCKGPGVVLCASKAERKMYVMKNGALVKTIRVRFGGFTNQRDGKLRVHHTRKGTYRVYKKHPNPYSARYGAGVMPYSVMFDPNMYVHYSADFASKGYTTSSHGCVNVGSLAEAKWVYNFTPVGSTVVVY